MSRTGRKPIAIPGGVDVTLDGRTISVRGPNGSCRRELLPDMRVLVEDGEVRVERSSDTPRQRAMHGLMRSLLANMVEGVTRGFEKELEIVGVGYRVVAESGGLSFQLGLSHPVFLEPTEGIEFEVVNPNLLKVRGIDKELVGRVADGIRRLRPPEPYKGKGIRYRGEQVRRKAGKTAM